MGTHKNRLKETVEASIFSEHMTVSCYLNRCKFHFLLLHIDTRVVPESRRLLL